MKSEFQHTSARSCAELQSILRDEDFLRAYAERTDALRCDLATSQSDGTLRIEVTRVNATEGIPSFLKAFVGAEAEVVESTTWPAEIADDGCTTTETVDIRVGSRHGHLDGGSTLTPTADGRCHYSAKGEFRLHGVPGLVRGKAEGMVVDLIRNALEKKMALADTWPK